MTWSGNQIPAAFTTVKGRNPSVEIHKRRVSMMSVINELIRTEANGTLSFGNYSLAAKSKVEDFEHEGDLYKVKTFKEITNLERN